jgi:putative transcriptional regulator
MKDAAFRELLKSVKQAGTIQRGERKPSRVATFRPEAVKAVRARLGQTQEQFALMIGVSVATLRNRLGQQPVFPTDGRGRLKAAGPMAVTTAEQGHAEPRRARRRRIIPSKS